MRFAPLRGPRKRPPAAPPEKPWDARLRRIETVISLALGVPMIAGFIVWQISTSRDPGFAQRPALECRALYASASTPQDTARVDLLHPASADQEDPNLPTCGTLRRLGALARDTTQPPQN